jgi:hypothetical protein
MKDWVLQTNSTCISKEFFISGKRSELLKYAKNGHIYEKFIDSNPCTKVRFASFFYNGFNTDINKSIGKETSKTHLCALSS